MIFPEITIRNMNPLDPDSVELACAILRARHRQALLQQQQLGWADDRVLGDIASRPVITVATLDEVDEADAVGDTVSVSDHFQGQTRAFLERMVAFIRDHGPSTLDEVAQEHGISLDTARAYIRNAGRTAKAHGVPIPVYPEWDHDEGCNLYAIP